MLILLIVGLVLVFGLRSWTKMLNTAAAKLRALEARDRK